MSIKSRPQKSKASRNKIVCFEEHPYVRYLKNQASDGWYGHYCGKGRWR